MAWPMARNHATFTTDFALIACFMSIQNGADIHEMGYQSELVPHRKDTRRIDHAGESLVILMSLVDTFVWGECR
jgi:hypothetical protein